ncbi:DUF3185 family protein [Marinospirillum insulare]|uniref:DUF3185 family protein n=1 Tax=Marinospirillum insulare TaxID=217169 RepID=A0ABQ6A0Y7_9GAMM|nr:DUF3185 family protein [Marinospirillum insulare]GLR63770.1 hypothetical protein GCM10007878_12050 [Marinospirillum insulare]
MRRATSLLLIVIGILLLYWGYDLQERVDVELIKQITGEAPEKVWQYYVTGGIAVLVGILGVWKSK